MNRIREWPNIIVTGFCLIFVGYSSLLGAPDISGRWAVQWEVLHNYQYWIWTWYYPTYDIYEDENIDDDLGKRGPIPFFVTQSGEKIEGSYLGPERCGESIVRYYFTGTISDDNEVYFSIVVPALSCLRGLDFSVDTEDVIDFVGNYNDVNKVITGIWAENQQRSYWLHWEYYPEYLCFDVEFLDLFWCGNFTITISPGIEVDFLDKRPPYPRVVGATTDGVTEVIIKIWPLPEGTTVDDVQITIIDGDAYGYLRDDKNISNRVFTQTYVAPEKFPGDIGESKKYINFLITVKGELLSVPTFTLIRPPVIMVHGLWSNFAAFSKLKWNLRDSGFVFLYGPNYKNSASLAENSQVLQSFTNNVFDLVRMQRYACTKVDIVAHSMGGLLSKRISHSFAKERVRKIITIGTPYEGSPWADLLWKIRESPLGKIIEVIIVASMPADPPAITGGAIEDLRADPCNEALPVSTQIPGVDCKTVVGEGLYATSLPTWYHYLLCLLTGKWTAETIHTAIFGPNMKSDWIVSEASQKHDASDSCEIAVLWHCTETSDADFIDIVLESLNRPSQISLMASPIRAPARPREINHDFIKPQTKTSIFDLLGKSESNGTVEILMPNEGQTVIAGESVSISVQGAGETNEATVFAFFGPESSYADLVNLPWIDEVNVPPDSIGTKAKIIVVGLDPNRNITDVDEVNLGLESNIWLEEIFFGFGNKWYFDFINDPCQSHELQLYPLGRFSDDSEHTLEVLGESTVYQSLNEYVATVDSNGLVTIHAPGSAAIIVSNSGKTAALQIEVNTHAGDLNLDGAVNFLDFATFANRWRDVLCSYTNLCGGADLNMSTDVTCADLAIFTDNWLKEDEF